jgi:hypothetical protein
VRIKGPVPETVTAAPALSAVVCTGSVTAHRVLPKRAESVPKLQPVAATVSGVVVPAATLLVATHTARRPSSGRKYNRVLMAAVPCAVMPPWKLSCQLMPLTTTWMAAPRCHAAPPCAAVPLCTNSSAVADCHAESVVQVDARTNATFALFATADTRTQEKSFFRHHVAVGTPAAGAVQGRVTPAPAAGSGRDETTAAQPTLPQAPAAAAPMPSSSRRSALAPAPAPPAARSTARPLLPVEKGVGAAFTAET